MKNIIISVLAALVVVGAMSTFYFYRKYNAAMASYQSVKYTLDNPKVAAETELKQLTDEIGKVMLLPKDEEASVATIIDKDKVKGQQFFTNALNGDKILIYAKAMKAILYRPSEHKVIEVAPISSQTESEGVTTVSPKKPTPTPTE